MRYRVRGVHRESGKVIDQVAEAPSVEVLRARADAKGVTVVAIDAVQEPLAIVEARRIEPLQQAMPMPMQPPVQQQPNVIHVAPVVNVSQPKRGSSMGIASIVLGTLAFLICWIPMVGCIGLPLSALGLLLGVIGFVVAITRDGDSIGLAIAGGAISLVALAVVLLQMRVIDAMGS